MVCDGLPITANQQIVSQILLTELKKCLPTAKVAAAHGPVRVMVEKHGKLTRDEADKWIDLSEFNGMHMHVPRHAIFAGMHKRKLARRRLVW